MSLLCTFFGCDFSWVYIVERTPFGATCVDHMYCPRCGKAPGKPMDLVLEFCNPNDPKWKVRH